MPARNIIREFAPENYYHVYNRGVGKQDIFIDDQDYAYYLRLLKRYLSNEKSRNTGHSSYNKYHTEVELLAFCLMPNHFHLYFYQASEFGVTRLMKSVTVAYSMYFNKRYRRVGALFQQRFRASRVASEAYYEHVTRYIHMNPDDYHNWQWSSLPYYLGKKHADWLRPNRVLTSSPEAYGRYLDEYKDRREELKELKKYLAG